MATRRHNPARRPRPNPPLPKHSAPEYITVDTYKYRGRIIELLPVNGGRAWWSQIDGRTRSAKFFRDRDTAMAWAMSNVVLDERRAAGDEHIDDAELGVFDAIQSAHEQGSVTRATVARELKLFEKLGWPYDLRAKAFNQLPLQERLALIDFLILIERGRVRL